MSGRGLTTMRKEYSGIPAPATNVPGGDDPLRRELGSRCKAELDQPATLRRVISARMAKLRLAPHMPNMMGTRPTRRPWRIRSGSGQRRAGHAMWPHQHARSGRHRARAPRDADRTGRWPRPRSNGSAHGDGCYQPVRFSGRGRGMSIESLVPVWEWESSQSP